MLGPHGCDQSHSGHARDQTIVIGRLDRDDVRRCVVAQPLVLFDIVSRLARDAGPAFVVIHPNDPHRDPASAPPVTKSRIDRAGLRSF